jgi:hypothetical protein
LSLKRPKASALLAGRSEYELSSGRLDYVIEGIPLSNLGVTGQQDTLTFCISAPTRYKATCNITKVKGYTNVRGIYIRPGTSAPGAV